jgi:hypothetical protein
VVSKDALRQAMPVTASIVDTYRQWLGKVIYAEENGKVIDRREPVNADSVFDIPANYHPMRQVERKERK